MTNKELEEKIEELSAQIKALKSELKKETPKGEIWIPKEGEFFWYVDEFGEVYGTTDRDYMKIGIGNCYPTEEKAEFEAQREKYTRLFRQYVEQHSEPLNWNIGCFNKWYVYYDYDTENIHFNVCASTRCMEVYGSSKEVMRDAVAFIGEDNVKKYVLGVESE